jgi:PhnB protein
MTVKQINPYLMFGGNCEEAFKFYEKALGGKIEMMSRFADAPAEMQQSPEWKNKIMHVSLSAGNVKLMGSDAPSGHQQTPQGFAVSLQVADPQAGEALFKTLSEGGAVTMPFQPTFWAKGFGMCTDRFGIPWMVNCE